MNEVVVDDREIVAMVHGVDQLLAHAHQRRRPTRREIEAPEELEPPRLGCVMDLGRGRVGGRVEPGRGRRAEPGTVGPEPARQRLEEGNAGARGQLAIAGEDFARERDARGFAAARQQILAKLDEVGRALLGDLAPVARAVDQRAAALRNGLQHVAEEGGIHERSNLLPGRVNK